MLTFNPNISNICSFKSNPFANLTNGSDLTGRKILNLACDVFEKQETKEKRKELLGDSPKIDRYIKAGRLFGSNIDIEINTEQGILDKIVNSGKSTIFIMNHDNQKMDPLLLLIFNTMLMSEYKKHGDKYQESRIILNENILKSMSAEKRRLYEELGAVGINVSGKDKIHNAKKLVKVMKEFAEDKANIFIFPEGVLCTHKFQPLENKFQNGVATMVLKELKMKKEVQVVPLGFSYPKTKNLAGIYMGNPIIFRTNDDGVVECTSGDILSSQYSDSDYKQYYSHFKDKEFTPILNHGEKIDAKSLTPFISGILCENLKICKAESINSVKEDEKTPKTAELI